MKIWRPLREIFSGRRSKSKDKEILVGRLAQSVSGRDKGMMYVITSQPDGIHVTVCDGKRRTTDKPKLKNIRHLLMSGEYVPDSFISKGRVTATDAEISAFIAENTDI